MHPLPIGAKSNRSIDDTGNRHWSRQRNRRTSLGLSRRPEVRNPSFAEIRAFLRGNRGLDERRPDPARRRSKNRRFSCRRTPLHNERRRPPPIVRRKRIETRKARHLQKDDGLICGFIADAISDFYGKIAIYKNICLLSISFFYFNKELIYYIF